MEIKDLPASCGVYIMRDSSGTVVYVGKAKNLKKRVSQYFAKSRARQSWKIPGIVSVVRRIDYIIAQSEREALIMERELISRRKPFFNAMWRDDKTYPRLKLTVKEDFPRIFFTRKKIRDGSLYFGPYPKTAAVKNLLAYLRKIKYVNLRRCSWNFGLRKKLNRHKIRSCIYYHTGQCPAPCAGKISRKEYLEITCRIIKFFRGDFRKLLGEFKSEMARASANLEYEKAALRRDFINAIKHLSERVRVFKSERSFLEREISRSAPARELKKALKLEKTPFHIEAFDASGLFARHCAGSSVCFINAKKNPAHYRRYKIKRKDELSGSDDPAMIREIVLRRAAQLTKSGKASPDLLLIDGGPAQLESARSALKEAGLRVPAVSLAKKNEEIYASGKKRPLKIEKDNTGLRLLMEIRDEAHRFAINYHRKLRDEKFLNNEEK